MVLHQSKPFEIIIITRHVGGVFSASMRDPDWSTLVG